MNRLAVLMMLAGCGENAPSTSPDLAQLVPDAAAAPNHGLVTIHSETFSSSGMQQQQWGFGAQFIAASGDLLPRLGTCAAPLTPTSPAPTAGKITITVGSQSEDLYPNASGSYVTQLFSSSVWSGGETVSASAAGADVPAFSGSTVAPHQVTVTSPDLKAQPNVVRSQDLSMTWTGGGATDSILVTVSTSASSVMCRFPSASGGGTVPTTALAAFSAGSATLQVATLNDTAVPAGTWEVAIAARSAALQSDGSLYSGTVRLQ